MRKLAIEYYRNGYNCSQCILKAASVKFNFSLSKYCLKMCSPVSNGFGIKSTCSVLIAAIMVLGVMFNETCAKRLRIRFLNDFATKHGSLNCAHLKKDRCEEIISSAADILEKIILSEQKL